MGEPLEERFGDEAKPTFERLSTFFKLLEQYRFINWKNTD
jgi:hypothetical protein